MKVIPKKQSDLEQGKEYILHPSESGQFCHYIDSSNLSRTVPSEPTKATFVGTFKAPTGMRNIFYSWRLGAYWMYGNSVIDYIEEVPKYFLLAGDFEWCELTESWIVHDLQRLQAFDSYEEATAKGEQGLNADEFSSYIVVAKGDRISINASI